MALKDYPEIKKEFDKLMAEKEGYEAQILELRKAYDAKQGEIEVLVADQKAISVQIKAIENPRIIEINQKLSAMARATGGKALSDNRA